MKNAAQVPATQTAAPRRNGRRVQVRRSGVHGKGVFALSTIPAGETIIEYVGERITWKEALRRHPHDPAQPNHTFYFHIDDQHVIDANVGGNASRWINHACDTNCEADEQDGGHGASELRELSGDGSPVGRQPAEDDVEGDQHRHGAVAGIDEAHRDLDDGRGLAMGDGDDREA